MPTPLFPNINGGDIPYLRSSGVQNPDRSIREPGQWVDATRNDTGTAHYPQVTQVTDYELTGTDPSSATWTLTVTPVTMQSGAAAAAHALQPASVSVTADNDSFDDVVIALVAAVNAAITSVAAAYSTSRIGSYVDASVSPVNPHKIRLTAREAGAVFTATITSTVGGDGFTPTTITSVVTSTVKVGLYYVLDTTKGEGGYDVNGNPYLTEVTSSVNPDNLIGPVMLGANTQPVEQGFPYRQYKAGANIPYAKYGHPAALSEAAVALASGPAPVYVRHTTSGDSLAGMAADAAQAAVGATANLWTGTITATDDTLYQVQIQIVNNDGELVSETIAFTSGTSTTTTLISTGLKANLATKTSLTGLLTGGGTTTLTLTGPADGRAVTVTSVGPGAISFAETDPEVNTHHLVTRGDKFIAPCSGIGPVAIAIPID